MKQLVDHVLDNYLDDVLKKSSVNCHTTGLHSIMLYSADNFSMRIYVVTPDHNLWRNRREGLSSNPMVSGYHPHHSNITLHCTAGEVVNRRARLLAEGEQIAGVLPHSIMAMTRYLFDKAVEKDNSAGGFVEDGEDCLIATHNDVLRPGDKVYMPAADLHTIFVERGSSAAWFVYNGRPNPEYVPYLWTNTNLNEAVTPELYQPMSEAKLRELLAIANLG